MATVVGAGWVCAVKGRQDASNAKATPPLQMPQCSYAWSGVGVGRSRGTWGAQEGRGGRFAPHIILTCFAAAACIQIAISTEQEALAVRPTVIQTGHQIQDGLHTSCGLFTFPAKEGPERAGCSALLVPPPPGLPSPALSPPGSNR